MNLKSELENSLQSSPANFDEVTARDCSNDAYSGTEYVFYGDYIPLKPIMDVISRYDDAAIAEVGFVDEGNPRLILFVADLTNKLKKHPAFV